MAQRHPKALEPQPPKQLRFPVEYIDPDEVQRYLAKRPEVVPIVPEAMRRLADFFGPDSRFRLHVSWEPDDSGEEVSDDVIQEEIENFVGAMLILDVVTDLDVDDAENRLDRFDDEWWLELPPVVLTQLVVNTSFA